MNNGPRGWPAARTATRHLVSFDRGVAGTSDLLHPDRHGFFHAGSVTRQIIARGAGMSYCAASFGPDTSSIDMSSFDRVLGFDAPTAVVEVEAGIRLGALFHFLQRRDFFLAVQPGHANLSVGGCIAADVHGKNQVRDGTFIGQVESVRLFHPAHGFMNLTESNDAELFRATCGGYGLTGIIVSARLRVRKITGSSVRMIYSPVGGLLDAADELRSLSQRNDFVYSWHDLSTSRGGFGAGYVAAGTFNRDDQRVTRAAPASQLKAQSGKPLQIPILNSLTTQIMNSLHVRSSRPGKGFRDVSLFDSFFPVHRSEVYFRLFGRRGFHEFQAVIPHASFGDYVSGLRTLIAAHGVTVTLASAKVFAGPRDLLRFSGEGICLAINIPRNRGSGAFMQAMDALLSGVGGHPNIIKDSRLPRSALDATYPDADRFRAILRRWDSQRIFQSELSRRLSL